MKGNYKYGMAEGKTLMEMSEFGRTGEFMVLKIWICICMHACIYACKYTYVYKHTYVSVYIYVCFCICVHNAYIYYLCLLKGPRSKDTMVAMNTPSTQFFTFNTIPH